MAVLHWKDYFPPSTVSSPPWGWRCLRGRHETLPLLNSALIILVIHGKCMRLYLTIHSISMLTPFSPLPLNCSTIDHEGLRLRSFIGFQRGPSDCCYGLPNTCCCKSKPDPMHKSISECDGNPMCKSITGSDVCRQ